MRQIESDKLKVILALKDSPIIIVACKKVGLPTSSFYRWKHEDKRFRREVDRALARGRDKISDVAEAHLVTAVRKGDMRAVLYWLKVFREPYKKQEKSIIEIKHKQIMAKHDKKGHGRLLQPTTPMNSEPIDRKILKEFAKILGKGVVKQERERALMRALAKRGASGEEIRKLLRDETEQFEHFFKDLGSGGAHTAE